LVFAVTGGSIFGITSPRHLLVQGMQLLSVAVAKTRAVAHYHQELNPKYDFF
jgi:hypothetical protein